MTTKIKTNGTLRPESWGQLASMAQNMQSILDAPHGAWSKTMVSKKKPTKYTVNRLRTIVLSKSDKVYVSAFSDAEARKLAQPMFGPMPDFTVEEFVDGKNKVKDVITVWKT